MSETEFILTVQDCIQGMSELPEKSVDLVVTSPPYNLGIKYGKYHDQIGWADYRHWSVQWAGAVKRVLKEEGSFFLNVGASSANPLLPHQIILDFSDLFVLQNTFHWIKSISIETNQGQQISAGHFKPIRSQRYVNDCHEYVFHLTRYGQTNLDRLGLGVPYADKSNIARWGHTGGRDLRCRGNTWFIPYQTILSRLRERPHPATFPVALAANCIRIHGRCEELVVLDPFLGIGHAALAAKQCRVRRFVGFDIDAEYVAVARAAVKSGSTAAMGALPATRRRARKKAEEKQTFLNDGLFR